MLSPRADAAETQATAARIAPADIAAVVVSPRPVTRGNALSRRSKDASSRVLGKHDGSRLITLPNGRKNHPIRSLVGLDGTMGIDQVQTSLGRRQPDSRRSRGWSRAREARRRSVVGPPRRWRLRRARARRLDRRPRRAHRAHGAPRRACLPEPRGPPRLAASGAPLAEQRASRS